MISKSTTLCAGLKKHKFALLLTVMLVLLISVTVGAGFSLAKYAQSVQSAQSAAVGSFVPTITYGESWELEETLVAGGFDQPNHYPFAVANEQGSTPVLVVVELTVEQVLPIACELYLGEQCLEPDSVAGNTRTYTYLVQEGAADFSLSVFWLEGERDERFNGLTNDIHMTVVCEQAQIGGAG